MVPVPADLIAILIRWYGSDDAEAAVIEALWLVAENQLDFE